MKASGLSNVTSVMMEMTTCKYLNHWLLLQNIFMKGSSDSHSALFLSASCNACYIVQWSWRYSGLCIEQDIGIVHNIINVKALRSLCSKDKPKMVIYMSMLQSMVILCILFKLVDCLTLSSLSQELSWGALRKAVD